MDENDILLTMGETRLEHDILLTMRGNQDGALHAAHNARKSGWSTTHCSQWEEIRMEHYMLLTMGENRMEHNILITMEEMQPG